jgi:hypothetical protein
MRTWFTALWGHLGKAKLRHPAGDHDPIARAVAPPGAGKKRIALRNPLKQNCPRRELRNGASTWEPCSPGSLHVEKLELC